MQPALIARIVASPDDPGAWLVYRDWLLEQGDPRGPWLARALDGDGDAITTASYQHIEVFAGDGRGNLQPAEVDALRRELEHALPRTRFEVDWDRPVAREPVVRSAPTERVDAQSRDGTGRVNAMLRYMQRDDD